MPDKKQRQEKVLYFEGAGWSDPTIDKAIISNCRIRTAFHLDDGRRMYLEIIGSERTKHSSSEVCQWPYTGFVDCCHYITADKPNDDCNNHPVMLPKRRGPVENNTRFEYTEAEVLKFVNSLGASFTAVKVVPDLGGYRVFPGDRSRVGPNGYYYGDEFQFDPDMTAKREAVYDWAYQKEKEELDEDWKTGGGRFVHMPGGAASPTFSLWVDEHDSGLLHLLRHFAGYNKHWAIRTDAGDKLEDCLATMRETILGRHGC